MPNSANDIETLDYDHETTSGRRVLVLHAIGHALVSTHTLPTEGQVVIGRSEQAGVSIPDPSISRRHALIHLGPSLRLEDLGSANGIRVGGRKLRAHEIVVIAPGETIDLGTVVLVLQKRPIHSVYGAQPATPLHAAIAAAQGAHSSPSASPSARMRRVHAIAELWSSIRSCFTSSRPESRFYRVP